MKYLMILALLPSFVLAAPHKLSLMGSVFYNSSEATDVGQNITEVNTFTYGLGIRSLIDINSKIFFRTGAQVINKEVTMDYDVLGSDVHFNQSLTYLAIPLTPYISFNENFGLFGGVIFQTKIKEACYASGIAVTSSDVCNDSNGTDMIFPIVIGLDVNLNSNMGFEFSYEHPTTDSSKNTKVKSLVTSFLYHF